MLFNCLYAVILCKHIAEKIIHLRKHVGVTRFLLHVLLATMPHADVLRAVELLGTEVALRVRKEVKRWEAERQGIRYND